MRRSFVAAAALLLAAACRDASAPGGSSASAALDLTGAAGVAATFTPEDLGTLAGGAVSIATGINAAGDVAGGSEVSVGGATVSHPVLWTGVAPQDLGLPFGTTGQATDLNDARVVVGFSTQSFTTRGFLWRAGAFTMIDAPAPPPPAQPLTSPQSINNADVVVGYHRFGRNNATHAFRYTAAGGLVDIHPAGFFSSVAYDVSDQGVVAGYVILRTGETHAARWSASNAFTDLGTLGGGFGVANGVNDAGAIVGVSTDVAGALRPFIWRAGTGMVPSPVDAEANDISDAGRIVGTRGFSPPDTITLAVTARGRGAPQTLPLPATFTSSKALAVSRCGHIAGIAGPTGGPFHAARWRIAACD